MNQKGNRVMMFRALVVGGLLVLANGANAALLGTYTFTASDTEVPPDATSGSFSASFSAFTRVNVGPVGGQHNGTFRADSWNTSGTIDQAEYVQFAVTPASGTRLTLTDISLLLIGEASGPNDVQIEVYDSAGPLVGSTSFTAVRGTSITRSFDFADSTSDVGFTFRIYGWNSANASGSLSFDDVAINGSLAAVPEPVNVALAIFGLVLAGGVAGRRMLGRK